MKKEPLHVKVIRDSAKSLGYGFRKYDPEGALHVVSKNGKEHLVNRSSTVKTSKISYILADNKRMTVDTLSKFNIPVPKQKMVTTISQALFFFRKHKPIVVKPNKSSLGKGVTVGVKTLRDLSRAFKFAQKFDKRVLVEEFVPGDDYRVTVIDYKKVFVMQRVPAFIVGDGKHDVEYLVKQKNKIKLSYKRDIKIDSYTLLMLRRKGFTLDSIPALDETVYLRKAANIAEGGTSIDFTNKISPELKALAINASKVLKLPCAGVDIMTEDISSDKGVIIEVNPRPHVIIHHHPHVGVRRYPGQEILKMLFRR
jgi:cyanophycin synthetase